MRTSVGFLALSMALALPLTSGAASADEKSHATAKPCTPAPHPGEGYKPLFDGTEPSLAKWRQAGPGGFEYTDCALLSYGGLGMHWYSAKEFDAPYSLKLDWMIPGDDNSGIFVGFPHPHGDPWSAVTHGEEIQIDPTDDPDHTTGAIYDEQGADIGVRDAALNPAGEWNTYNIVVTDDSITVYLNGTEINHWIDDDPNVDLSRGYIGIQNHGDRDDTYFRNIRIKRLPQ